MLDNPTDIRTSDDIKVFVDAFYERIQEDELLGPIFALRVAGNNWAPHLEKMYRFWESVLFSRRTYRGNPFARHVGLPVDALHFDRWVKLFEATIDQHFAGPVADDAKVRAVKMALMFQHKLAYLKEHPGFDPLM